MPKGSDDKNWICVGAFAGAHGVRGEVKVKSFTDDPAALGDFDSLHRGPNGPTVRLKITRPVKNGFAARVEGIETREQAMAVSGTRLYVPRTALPATASDEDEFYLSDLIGLKVEDTVGSDRGVIRAVPDFGAGHVLEVFLHQPVKGLGRSVVVPFTQDLVPTVDLAGERVVVDLDRWVAAQSDAGGDTGGTSDD